MNTPALFMIQSSFAFWSRNASANFCIDLHMQHLLSHLLMQSGEQVHGIAHFGVTAKPLLTQRIPDQHG